MTIRAVSYLRMSTARQEMSIPDQRKRIEEYAKKRGFELIAEYKDAAISGDRTEKRTGFLRMLEDAKLGKFQAILCFDKDRFGRFNTLEQGFFCWPLVKAGVRLVTVMQGTIDWTSFDGRIVDAVATEANQLRLVNMAGHVLSHQLSRAKDGKSNGGVASYGYKYQRRKLVPDPEESKIVKWIFQSFAQGKSIRWIARELTNRGVRPPQRIEQIRDEKGNVVRTAAGKPKTIRRGRLWYPSVVRRMLCNKVYCGDYLWNKNRQGKYKAVQGREIVDGVLPRRTESQDLIDRKDNHPPLIDRQTFETVQWNLEQRNISHAPWRKRSQDMDSNPLHHLVNCGHCGAPMLIRSEGGQPKRSGKGRYKTVRILLCSTYNTIGRFNPRQRQDLNGNVLKGCQRNRYEERQLVHEIFYAMDKEYFGNKQWVASLKECIRRQAEAPKEGGELDRHDNLAKRHAELDRQIKRWEDSLLNSVGAPEDILSSSLANRLRELQRERQRVRDELKAIEKPVAMVNTLSALKKAIRRFETIHENLDKALDKNPEKIRRCLAEFIAKFSIHFKHEASKGGQTVKSRFDHWRLEPRPQAIGISAHLTQDKRLTRRAPWRTE